MKKSLSVLLIILLFAPAVVAEEMPAPRRMPRTPVSREPLLSSHDVAPASHQVEGQATIMDGEKLRIGESDLRLFGIVPPQLAASFGPQARNALDGLTSNQNTSCGIRDRDREGRLLATCHNAAGNDLALELLKRGLAVTARGSLANTEFEQPYMSAERAAQNARTGLWSVAPPAPAPASAYVSPPVPVPASSIAVAAPVVATPVVVTPAATVTTPVVVVAKPVSEIKHEEKIPTLDVQKQEQVLAQSQASARIDDAAWNPSESVGFFERYQILIACGLMLATTLSIITALWAQKRRDRMDEMKSVAAALRGELMAARSVCIGRAKSITNDNEDHNALWPRIRSTLYQASVTRLGILGADLARHIASIYGQSGDYAALYSPTTGIQDAPKKHAMETLAKHIDTILPILAHIEKTGNLPRKTIVTSPTALAPVAPTYRDEPRVQTAEPAPLPQTLLETTAPEPMTPQIAGHETAESRTKKPSAFPFKTLPADIIQEITAPPLSFTNDSPPINAVLSTPIARASISLWDNLRNLFQTGSSSVPADPSPVPVDEYSEYAAMIEADMAHYQYGEAIESFDISPHKKRG